MSIPYKSEVIYNYCSYSDKSSEHNNHSVVSPRSHSITDSFRGLVIVLEDLRGFKSYRLVDYFLQLGVVCSHLRYQNAVFSFEGDFLHDFLGNGRVPELSDEGEDAVFADNVGVGQIECEDK